jgi:hypothetical protein
VGVYNPNIPKILGQEWVPIRDEDITFSPASNTVELGHGFTVTSSRTLQDARFYLDTLPTGRSVGQTFLAQVYPRGTEDHSGPVQSIIIPCNNGFISGGATLTNASSVADAVFDASDNRYITFPTSSAPEAQFHFAVSQYSQELFGKRILGVNILYTMAVGSSAPATPPEEALRGVFSVQNVAGDVAGFGSPIIFPSLIGPSQFSTVALGEIDQFWSNSAPISTSDRFPWIYAGLQDFELSTASASRINFHYTHNILGTQVLLSYVAMQVLFCDETRVAFAGRSFGESGFTSSLTPYTPGTNILPFRDLNYNTNPVLTPGDYTVVLSSADTGNAGGTLGLETRQISLSQYPALNGLRDVYNLSSHPGVTVTVPFPMDDSAVGKVFETQSSHVLPQISLHTSSGPLTEVHVYGRQARAQVYGTVTATQEIFTDSIASASYPQVRFYARRFGETTVPLLLSSTSFPTSTVNIAPEDFDALDEVLDGWKEITLTFATPPTMVGGTNPQWKWSASGEAVGNRWEVLGAYAPALSGIPSNLLNKIPSPNQLSISTYGAPISGAPINLGWVPGYSPLVSATTDDQTADAFLIFSQDMPTITGMSISVLSQAITGIGQNCGINPSFIPSAIQYNRITWPSQAAILGYINDTYTRTLTDSWGSTDTGQAYTLNGAATAFDVTGSQGTIQPSVQNSNFYGVVNTGSPNHELYVETKVNSIAITGSMEMDVVLRWTDNNNYYYGGIFVSPGGAITYVLNKVVAGVTTTDVFAASGLVYTEGTFMSIRARIEGSLICFKIWPTLSEEPENWSFCTENVAIATGNFAGVLANNNNTNLTRVWTYDNLVITNDSYVFGNFELQRMDTVETTWQTIMSATNPVLTGFNDFEARIGILSSYRIRNVNLYDFAGPWSSTVTSTIPAPGVSGSDIVADSHILVFTTNQVQSGFYNLAYSMAWEDTPITEEFTFSEAGFVTMQSMYNKDFYTAFRPLERGGEEFTRNLLIQAAAIAPETLADFTSLRNMAWFNVNYICVRDEDGNRWFSTVIVPDGRVRRDRRLYLATVKVIEVTNTPTPVDPS